MNIQIEQFSYTYIYDIIVYFYNFFVSYASAMICLWFDKIWWAILWKRQ